MKIKIKALCKPIRLIKKVITYIKEQWQFILFILFEILIIYLSYISAASILGIVGFFFLYNGAAIVTCVIIVILGWLFPEDFWEEDEIEDEGHCSKCGHSLKKKEQSKPKTELEEINQTINRMGL